MKETCLTEEMGRSSRPYITPLASTEDRFTLANEQDEKCFRLVKCFPSVLSNLEKS